MNKKLFTKEFFEWEEIEAPKEFNISLETAREIVTILRGNCSVADKITNIWRNLQ